MRPGSEDNLVMTEEGKVVRARDIKEMHKTLIMEDLDKLMGTPHDLVGTLRAAVRDERRGDELAAPEVEDDSKYVPMRVQIPKPIIEQLGPTSGCRKCQVVMSNNKGYQFVNHTTECRDRLIELMRQDERFRRLVEAADERQVRRLAEVLERRDQATQQRQQRQEVPARPARGEARVPEGASGSQEALGGQKRQAEQQLDPGDDNEEGDTVMGIPLATESSGVGVRKPGTEKSTEMEEEEEEEEPARQRARHLRSVLSNKSGKDSCGLWPTRRLQMKTGNMFIVEHPASASSWTTDEMKRLTSMKGVTCLVLDQCMYELVSEDQEGVAPARKTTRIAANLWGAERLSSTRCNRAHRHEQLVGGKAKKAQEYPGGFCQSFEDVYRFHHKLARADRKAEVPEAECQEGDDHVEWLGWDLGRGGESWADALEDDHDEVLYTEAQQRQLEGTATQAAEETVVDPGSPQLGNMDDNHPPRDELHETLDDLDPDQNFQNHYEDEHTGLALDPMMAGRRRLTS